MAGTERRMKLKVFTTQAGFYDVAVAASSQPKALAAWGVHQNLFAEGMAKIATDPATIAAALAKPGVVLRRALGTKGAFVEEPALPKVKGGKPKAQTDAKAKALARRKAAEALARRKAEEKAHADDIAALKRERAALDAKIAAEDKAFRSRKRR
jgi:hypothetical protein